MEDLLAEIDTDGSGTIELEEFKRGVKMLNLDVMKVTEAQNRVGLLCVVIFLWCIIGSVYFHWVEKWSYEEALYFIFISLSTIGLGDFVPHTVRGQMGLVVFCVVGLGLLAMIFDSIASMFTAAEDERLKKLREERKKRIDESKKTV